MEKKNNMGIDKITDKEQFQKMADKLFLENTVEYQKAWIETGCYGSSALYIDSDGKAKHVSHTELKQSTGQNNEK